jgi:hypothetical protein
MGGNRLRPPGKRSSNEASPVGKWGTSICLVPSADGEYMDQVLLALKHHAIVADSKTICLKASKWFGELQWVRLRSVQMYLLNDTVSNIALK